MDYQGTDTWIDPKQWKFSTNNTFIDNRPVKEEEKEDKRDLEQENLHKIQEESRKREQRRRR